MAGLVPATQITVAPGVARNVSSREILQLNRMNGRDARGHDSMVYRLA
jgi:hypothetical protein